MMEEMLVDRNIYNPYLHCLIYQVTQKINPTKQIKLNHLWKTTMDPETRTMLRVTQEDPVESEHIFSMLMGEEVGPRRSFIEAHAHEAQLDI